MALSRCVEVEAKPVRKHLLDPDVDKELEGYYLSISVCRGYKYVASS